MKKLAIIGTAGIPVRYGGFETLVEFLVPHLVQKMKVTVYCSNKMYKKEERLSSFKGARLTYIPLSANGMMSIIYDALSMLLALRKHDVLLVLGVSGAFMFPFLRLFSKKRIIVNIDGIEWKREKWSKWVKIYLKWSERIAVRFAHEVVCDNQVVLDYVKSTYHKNAQLIAYGGDHVKYTPIKKETIQKYPSLALPYAFKVARVEPENNIHVILKAFSISKQQLIIVGNWQNSEYGIKLKKQYSEYDNILLLDPIYDLNILDQFRSNCSYYVHGHSAGGTNPSLVEAMNLGLPILAYGVNFNVETTQNQAVYFKNEQELEKILQNIQNKELKNIGIMMKAIAGKRYTWKVIAQLYSDLILSHATEEVYSLN